MVMDIYTATGIAEGWLEAESHDEYIDAWQILHDTGTAYQLQGWFGRRAIELIEAGEIEA